MNLNNDIIDKICSDAKFECSGDDCFVFHVEYDYGTNDVDIKVKVKVTTKVKNINEDGTISASFYINGIKEELKEKLDYHCYYFSDKINCFTRCNNIANDVRARIKRFDGEANYFLVEFSFNLNGDNIENTKKI